MQVFLITTLYLPDPVLGLHVPVRQILPASHFLLQFFFSFPIHFLPFSPSCSARVDPSFATALLIESSSFSLVTFSLEYSAPAIILNLLLTISDYAACSRGVPDVTSLGPPLTRLPCQV
ncbi:hypothetical protein F4778DRAFT_503070 [Xylariomycetidae sp. FL2044]|nr:hypothetical protein F4778DRAFT_503070 [Xylariomycetidae sp. FL2044]